jgi:hypothetical protein
MDGGGERRVDLGGPDLLARLAAWAATLAADEAVAARARESWLRRAAEEEATFAGVLLDLAERGGPVVVVGRGGRRHRGVVVAVGHDFCGLRTAEGTDVLLSFAGLASVRPEPRATPAAGDRPVAVDVELAEALAAVAEDRPRVLVVTLADPDGLAGELRSVGRDVLTLRLDGADRTPAYVPVASVAELRLA